ALLEDIVRRCLQPTPLDRYASAKELLIALQSVAQDTETSPSIAKPQKRYRWLMGIVVLVLVAGLGVWHWRDDLFSKHVPDTESDGTRSFHALQKTPPYVTPAIMLDQIHADLQTARSPKQRRYITLAYLTNDASVDAGLRKQWV